MIGILVQPPTYPRNYDTRRLEMKQAKMACSSLQTQALPLGYRAFALATVKEGYYGSTKMDCQQFRGQTGHQQLTCAAPFRILGLPCYPRQEAGFGWRVIPIGLPLAGLLM